MVKSGKNSKSSLKREIPSFEKLQIYLFLFFSRLNFLKLVPANPLGYKSAHPTWLRGEGGPLSTGCLWKGIWRGVSRLSLRLASAMCSAVSFVIVTFFVFGVAFGLIAVAVLSFCFFGLAFGVKSFSGCGGFVASVFISAVWRCVFFACGGLVFAFCYLCVSYNDHSSK